MQTLLLDLLELISQPLPEGVRLVFALDKPSPDKCFIINGTLYPVHQLGVFCFFLIHCRGSTADCFRIPCVVYLSRIFLCVIALTGISSFLRPLQHNSGCTGSAQRERDDKRQKDRYHLPDMHFCAGRSDFSWLALQT